MKLTELSPQFLRVESADLISPTDDFALAQGISFKCPRCVAAPDPHFIVCWSRLLGAPEFLTRRASWLLAGTGYDDLSLNAEPPSTLKSVLVQGGCNAHFTITNGEVKEWTGPQ